MPFTVECICPITASFKKSVHHITPTNLNGTVKLLRELDRSDLADELIEYYIRARHDEGKLFDLKEYAFSGNITDPIVRERFDQQLAAARQLPSLIDAVKHIANNCGWSKAEIQVLGQATENDFYDLFKLDHGAELSRVVKACLRFEGMAEHQTIGQKARSALDRIGKESQLNAIRVNRYRSK